MRTLKISTTGLLAAFCLLAADPFYLRRSLPEIQPRSDDLTVNAQAASYKPVFGIGDKDAGKLQQIARYGELTLGPGGSSATVGYPAEEQIYYVLEGSGTLLYDGQKAPLKPDDFVYLPVNVKHGLANASRAPLRVVVIGFRIPPGKQVAPTPKLLRANAGDSKEETLSKHGPTTGFKLLMGHHDPPPMITIGDALTTLFLMDFAPGGTNIPHTHPAWEEIYLLMRGHGEMVAGKLANGQDARHPAKAGDVFFFAPNTQVGYYSGAKEGDPHDLILAVH